MIKVFTKDYHLTMKVKRAFNGMVAENDSTAILDCMPDKKDFIREVLDCLLASARIEQYRIEGNRIAFTSTGWFVYHFENQLFCHNKTLLFYGYYLQ